jgi:hypothetical protein
MGINVECRCINRICFINPINKRACLIVVIKIGATRSMKLELRINGGNKGTVFRIIKLKTI